MAGLLSKLKEESFHNWLKAALAILFSKEALIEFVSTEFSQFSTDLLKTVWSSPGITAGTTCNSCTTANLLKCHTRGFCNLGQCDSHDPSVPEKIPNRPCPNSVCDALMIAIRKEHRYRSKGPSWKNTDARSWCKDPFELAKCFFPPDGYSDLHSFEETDFNGILSVIINNKRFQNKLATQLNTDPNSCTQAREIGKAVRHSPDLLLTDADLAQYIKDLKNLLTDPKCLASDLKAQAAVTKLEELQANTLTIHADDITKVIKDNIRKSINTRHKAVLQDIQMRHKAVLQDIHNHLCTVKTASIDAIDEIIKAKITTLDEIRKEADQKKTDINVHSGQKKQEFDEHAGLLKKYIDKNADEKKKDIDVQAEQKKQDIDVHANQMKQDIDVHADQKKQDIEVHANQKKQDIDVHVDQKKQDIDVHADQKKQDIEVHIGQRKQDIDVHANQKKQNIDVHADQKKQNIDVHADQNKQDIDVHADQKKQDVDVHADQKKQEIDVHANQKKQDIDVHADQKKQEIDVHAVQKKQDVDVHADQKKQDIDVHANQKKKDIDVHADQKKQDIEVHIGQKKQDIDVHAYQKMQDIDVHADQKKQDIDVRADQKKQDIEVHIGQKKQDIDVHANQKKQDIDMHAGKKKQDVDVHADQKKQNIEVYIGQKKQDIDVHANQKKQYIDEHADRKKQDIDVHAGQKKQDIDVHADQKKQDIEVHIGQKKQDIDVHSNHKKQDIDVHANQKKQDIDVHADHRKQDIDVHSGQKKQDIDVHADQRKQDIEVHIGQKKHNIDLHANRRKQDIDVHADQKKQDIEVHIGQKKQDIDVHADQKKQDIDVHANQKKQDIDLFADQKKQEIAEFGKQEIKTDSQIKKEYAGFQTELIKMYRRHNSKIPLSPIAVEHDVPLVNLYVKPPLSAIDLQQWRGDQLGNPFKTPVNDYKGLFFLNDENAYKNIYITADAGLGKTSFSNHLCMTWCQAHDPEENMSHHFLTEDLQALKFFEFLFLIHLREAQRSLCDVDKFIYELVQNCLPHIKNSCELIDNILNFNCCLIVLDGLDEWVHPKCDKSNRKTDIPHTKFWSDCSLVTTSRPWKFDVIRLPSSKVDRHIEICELDRKSFRSLDVNAIRLLNDKAPNKPEMKIADFYQATSVLDLGYFMNNPLINLQILTLWYDGEDIGRSKCEFFSNIVELTLERGIAKNGPGPISAVTHINCNKPKCLKSRNQCNKHFALLYNLGKLAFFALFGIETALIINRAVALHYLESEEELEFCFKLGLLSQSKDYRYVSRQQSKLAFQHKPFQEYFSALYIQSGIERKTAREHILKTCISLESVLEMGNIFIFLSGMNPEVYQGIFTEIINFISADTTVSSYRTKQYRPYTIKPEYRSVFGFQTLQRECFLEIKMNGHINNCFPPIDDVIIDEESKNEEYLSSLAPIVGYHCDRIRSITIHSTKRTEFTEILNRLKIRSFRKLERLCLCSVVEREDLEHLLKTNLKTLRCLDIYSWIYIDNQYIDEMAVLSRMCLADIKSMPDLQNLCLFCFSMKHNELKDLFDFIKNRKIMTGIKLETIKCENHRDSCSGFVLDLSRHDKLHSLGLHKVRIHQLHVITARLEHCEIGLLPPGVASSWLRKTTASPVIHSLWCNSLDAEDLSAFKEILPTLLHLKELFIRKLPLGDLLLPIPPNMNSLHRVDLFRVSISCSVLRGLVDSVSHLAQPVIVIIQDCTVTPPEEYESIKTKIKTLKTFQVQFDRVNKINYKEFRFLKL